MSITREVSDFSILSMIHWKSLSRFLACTSLCVLYTRPDPKTVTVAHLGILIESLKYNPVEQTGTYLATGADINTMGGNRGHTRDIKIPKNNFLDTETIYIPGRLRP